MKEIYVTECLEFLLWKIMVMSDLVDVFFYFHPIGHIPNIILAQNYESGYSEDTS